MPATKTYLWQQAPFVRLLLPLAAGIAGQWYFPLSPLIIGVSVLICILIIFTYFLLPLKHRYGATAINGLAIILLIASLGAWLVSFSDIRKNEQWFGKAQTTNATLVLRLSEPLVEKQNSFKALADVQMILPGDSCYAAKGKVIVYFKKDSLLPFLTYGSRIVVKKPLQEIANSGNPGSFNYRQYCLFQGITHQVYLLPPEFILSERKSTALIQSFVFQIRSNVVETIRKYIPAEKEQGLAEALLIGYKDDLDKNLVQAYSNTGIVHIIAISGLHLGLIYGILLWLTKRFRKRKDLIWLRFFLIVLFLWAFSLVAGAQASVLRSAVMFTCIAYGEVISRRVSIYNTLALSAFLLLCYNPFWLWDVGFQLSYAAVLSIVIFFKPIYNWMYVSNKALDWIWKLNAVTLAAQILTLPISLYHFHQFPVLFLVANLIAVPLSSGILIGEILLLLVSFYEPLASGVGWLLQQLMFGMNTYVEQLDLFPFAVWAGFSISIIQACLLYGAIAGAALWLMNQQKKATWFALACLSGFVLLRSVSFYRAYNQKQLIVYQVPRHRAIDFIDGRNYFFVGDADLEVNDFLRNFHLQPSRTLHRITAIEHQPATEENFDFGGRSVMLVDSAISYSASLTKPVVDLVVLSKNPKLYINDLFKAFIIKQVVMDGSVPQWKKKLWKKDCDSLHLPYHDVTDKGAFVMKIQ